MNVVEYIKTDIADGVPSIDEARALASSNPKRFELVMVEGTDTFMLWSTLNKIEFKAQQSQGTVMPNVRCPITGITGIHDEAHYQENLSKPNDLADIIRCVQLFHQIFGHPVGEEIRALTREERQKRRNYMVEECEEFMEADTIDGQMDALLDLLYFAFGTMVIAGYPGAMVEEGFMEVQESNMTKLGEDGKPIYREDGKILKGPNFRLPQLQPIIDQFISKNLL